MEQVPNTDTAETALTTTTKALPMPNLIQIDDIDENMTVEQYLQQMCEKYVERILEHGDRRVYQFKAAAAQIRRNLENLQAYQMSIQQNN